MARPYDDERYLQWRKEINKLIFEYFDTEGNNEEMFEQEIEEMVADAKANV